MSALPPKADIAEHKKDVYFVREADIRAYDGRATLDVPIKPVCRLRGACCPSAGDSTQAGLFNSRSAFAWLS
jgi:hypothetical protein